MMKINLSYRIKNINKNKKIQIKIKINQAYIIKNRNKA